MPQFHHLESGDSSCYTIELLLKIIELMYENITVCGTRLPLCIVMITRGPVGEISHGSPPLLAASPTRPLPRPPALMVTNGLFVTDTSFLYR